MKIINQRAIITSINNLNKNFEVKITESPKFSFTLTLQNDAKAQGNMFLPSRNFQYYLEVGDVIEFKIKEKNGCEIVNLSCEILKFSKLKRNFISIIKRLDNESHPLKRCVLLHEPNCVLLSIKKNPEKISLIHKSHENN